MEFKKQFSYHVLITHKNGRHLALSVLQQRYLADWSSGDLAFIFDFGLF